MSTIASQTTSLTIIYSQFVQGADQRKHQSSASLAFVQGNHRWPENSPHKGPVTWKMFPFDDVIMLYIFFIALHLFIFLWSGLLRQIHDKIHVMLVITDGFWLTGLHIYASVNWVMGCHKFTIKPLAEPMLTLVFSVKILLKMSSAKCEEFCLVSMLKNTCTVNCCNITMVLLCGRFWWNYLLALICNRNT